MPKINPVKVHEYGPGDLRFIQNYETNVLADGTFQTLVPEDHVQYLTALGSPVVSVSKNKAGKPALVSRDLDAIARMLKQYGQAQMTTTKTRETLIFFKTTMSVAYCSSPDFPGRIFENGYEAQKACGRDDTGAYHWRGKNLSSQSTSSSFSVGVCARVVDKIVHKLPNGRFHVDHETAKPETGSFGAKLNTFNGGVFPPADFWSKENPDERRLKVYLREGESLMEQDGLQYVPYTEESAEFFYSMMHNLCTLAERMRIFFGDDDRDFLANINDPTKRLAIAGPRSPSTATGASPSSTHGGKNGG